MRLTDRELATVLAALRLWQSQDGGETNSELNAIASNEGQCEPLTEEEIDDLCERLNQ